MGQSLHLVAFPLYKVLTGDSKFLEVIGAIQFTCDNKSAVLGAVRNLINVFFFNNKMSHLINSS